MTFSQRSQTALMAMTWASICRRAGTQMQYTVMLMRVMIMATTSLRRKAFCLEGSRIAIRLMMICRRNCTCNAHSVTIARLESLQHLAYGRMDVFGEKEGETWRDITYKWRRRRRNSEGWLGRCKGCIRY